MIEFAVIILSGFAWSVGGQTGFGKGKRGLLLAIPYGVLLAMSAPWWAVPAQTLLLYWIYQCLSYDRGIELVYSEKSVSGWLIILLNGIAIGAGNILVSGHVYSSLVAGVVAFTSAVVFSNDARFAAARGWLFHNAPKRVWVIDFKDAWFSACFGCGCILGLAAVLGV